MQTVLEMQTDSCSQNLILTIDDREEASRLKRAGDTQRDFPGVVWKPKAVCFRPVSEAGGKAPKPWDNPPFQSLFEGAWSIGN